MTRLIKPVMYIAAIAAFLCWIPEATARGGGFHGGGFRGNEFHEGAGRFRGEGKRNEGGRGEDKHGQGQHKHNNNNNNNNNNTTNNYYGGGWGWGWGVGVADGIVVGDALSSSSQPSTVVVEQQVTQQQPAWMTSQQVPGAPAYGTRITTIPAGSREKTVMGTTAYENNGVWYRPVLGESGVYYQVVSPPPPEGDGSGNSQGQ